MARFATGIFAWIRHGRFALLLTALALGALAAGAVGSASGHPSPEPEDLGELETGTWTPADCEFTPPADRDPECGFLAVPADHDDPNGAQLLLHAAIYRAEADEPQPDPVLFLSGGPGEHALDVVALMFEVAFAALVQERDLVVLDQRGTGYSRPSLACTEVPADAFVADPDQLIDGLAECHERLQQEVDVDLELFNSSQSAGDVAMLREALEYDEWNLFGLSYGSRLALTVMRDHPEGIRSAVLDSPVPVEVSLYESVPEHAQRAIDLLVDTCAEDPVCSDAYPDLGSTLEKTVEALNDSPALPENADEMDEQGQGLTGDDFVGLVFSLLYDAAIIPLLPMIIHEASERRFDTVEELLVVMEMQMDEQIFQSLGQYVTVQCQEEVAFISREELEAAAEEYPLLQGFLEQSPLLGPRLVEVCETWGFQDDGSRDREAVASDVPALILAGEFDPITPPSWADLVEENLENAFAFTYPAMGHAVSAAHPCPLQMTLAFLDYPDEEPNADCIEQMPPAQFLPPDAELELPGPQAEGEG